MKKNSMDATPVLTNDPARISLSWVRATRIFKSGVYAVALTLAGIGCACLHAQTQNNINGSVPASSEFPRENMSRAGASAAEIKAVLLKDPGLMVELNPSVENDATDHGQIVSDSDLTSDNILERLETDAQFRSVATTLVQKYGYLLPRINPESDQAKEHELLVEERTKWLVQNQEQELAQGRQRVPAGFSVTAPVRSTDRRNLCRPSDSLIIA